MCMGPIVLKGWARKTCSSTLTPSFVHRNSSFQKNLGDFCVDSHELKAWDKTHGLIFNFINKCSVQWRRLHQQWNTWKSWIENWTFPYLLWLYETYVCLFRNWIHGSSQLCSLLSMELVMKIWRHSLVSFKHVSLWCLFFDPRQPNIGAQLRK